MDPVLDDAVRALEDAYRAGDFALVEPYLADDIVLDWSASIGPMRGVYHGHREARALFDQWAEAFERMDWKGRPIFRVGRYAAVAGRFHGRGSASGAEAPSIGGGQGWSLEGDRVKSVVLHQTDDESIRWARRQRIGDARLYFVCDARPEGRDPRPLLDAALRGGADIVQLRDPDLGDDDLVLAARPFREAAREHGALFILNDRPDLVERCGADGVHVGQDDAPVAEARRTAGSAALVGLSTHTPAQVDAAEAAEGDRRPDQISVGPVWETPTKPGRPATGLELLGHAARRATMPWFAIGGIDTGNVAEVVAAGAERVVVVRAIRDAEDPERAARNLREALDGGDQIASPAEGAIGRGV